MSSKADEWNTDRKWENTPPRVTSTITGGDYVALAFLAFTHPGGIVCANNADVGISSKWGFLPESLPLTVGKDGQVIPLQNGSIFVLFAWMASKYFHYRGPNVHFFLIWLDLILIKIVIKMWVWLQLSSQMQSAYYSTIIVCVAKYMLARLSG